MSAKGVAIARFWGPSWSKIVYNLSTLSPPKSTLLRLKQGQSFWPNAIRGPFEVLYGYLNLIIAWPCLLGLTWCPAISGMISVRLGKSSAILGPHLSGPVKDYTVQAKWRPSILKAEQMLKEIHWRNVNDIVITIPYLLWHWHISWSWLDRPSVLAKVATNFTNDPFLLVWSDHPISSQTYPAKAETRSFILAHEHHTLIRWMFRDKGVGFEDLPMFITIPLTWFHLAEAYVSKWSGNSQILRPILIR